MLRRTLQLSLLAALVPCVVSVACRGPAEPRVIIETASGGVPVEVELALTPATRQRGLMFRNRLGRNQGMLFVFPQALARSFWMKNTPLPLDIIYIDTKRRIVSVAKRTEPYSTRAIPSDGPARYVLEVNGGFADSHGVEADQEVHLPDFPEAAVR